MKAVMLKLGCVLLSLPLSQPALATVYYVSPGGSDFNAGTSAGAAFATPQQAVNRATNPGDMVAIMPGTYSGHGSTAPIVLKASGSGPLNGPGGGCTAPITIFGVAINGQRPIILGVPGAAGAGAIFGNGVSCVLISGLELSGWKNAMTWSSVGIEDATVGSVYSDPVYTNYGIAFTGWTGAPVHHIIMQDLYVHDFPGGGIGVIFGDYITIQRNYVAYNAMFNPLQGSGISLFDNKNYDWTTTTHIVVSGNLVVGNSNQVPSRILQIAEEPALATAAGQTRLNVAWTAGANYTQLVLDVPGGCIPPNTAIQGWNSNSILLSQATTCTISPGDQIVTGFATDGEGIIVDDSSESEAASLGVPYTARSLLTNNITINNGGAGILCGLSAHCDITFNTSYLDQSSAGNVGNNNSPGGISALHSSDVNVYNNIVYAGPNVAVLWDASTSGVNWGNNVLFGGYPGNFGHPIPGSNNVVGRDPLFVSPGLNPGTAYFQLQAGSPAIGAASSAFTRTTDYASEAVNPAAPPDSGAFQRP